MRVKCGRGPTAVSKKVPFNFISRWERVVDRRIRQSTNIHESQFGFMPGRSTTDAIFIMKPTIIMRNTEKGRRILE